MKVSQTTRLSKALLVAAALLSAPLAFAGPSVDSTEMKRAFAKAEQGPDQLRWYVQRTKTIYNLDYNEVANAYVVSKAAAAESTAVVVQAPTK